MATKRVPPTPISADATIADMIETLDKPGEYVRRVLEKLERCKRAHARMPRYASAYEAGPKRANYLIEYVREDARRRMRTLRIRMPPTVAARIVDWRLTTSRQPRTGRPRR
ncbi:hypothetical protein ACVOMV_33635 [Mesorhizobium atlanticum]